MTTDLPKILNRSVSSVWRIFTQGLGDSYQIVFKSERFNINETVTLKIPRIVDDETIEKVNKQLSANRLYKHKHLKNKYLLSRMIFCENCGFALVGVTNAGYSYYRHQPFRRCSSFASVRADVIENLVLTDIINNFGDVAELEKSMKMAVPDLEKRKELEKQCEILNSDLEKITVQKNRIVKSIANGTISDDDAKSEMKALKEKEAFYQEEIKKIDLQLETIPSEKQIGMKAELLHRMHLEFLRYNPARLSEMSYDDKKALLQKLFSGKTPDGKRQGVYITFNDTHPNGIYTIKGQLREIIGYFDSNVTSVDAD
ncbi:MAG: hypothetical protein A4E66_01760 [Syntrophus sp. PtaB.Bin001]|nr:MAG: hypothetical protein A4E66_01760 [Syntrophus sp. PtaB.Bin001]